MFPCGNSYPICGVISSAWIDIIPHIKNEDNMAMTTILMASCLLFVGDWLYEALTDWEGYKKRWVDNHMRRHKSTR